uniref:Uncharacterized protein n=1 Tax=Arundo donax TaxID=35708 RepID=A0A0A8ZR86_ARUDO
MALRLLLNILEYTFGSYN